MLRAKPETITVLLNFDGPTEAMTFRVPDYIGCRDARAKLRVTQDAFRATELSKRADEVEQARDALGILVNRYRKTDAVNGERDLTRGDLDLLASFLTVLDPGNRLPESEYVVLEDAQQAAVVDASELLTEYMIDGDPYPDGLETARDLMLSDPRYVQVLARVAVWVYQRGGHVSESELDLRTKP